MKKLYKIFLKNIIIISSLRSRENEKINFFKRLGKHKRQGEENEADQYYRIYSFWYIIVEIREDFVILPVYFIKINMK